MVHHGSTIEENSLHLTELDVLVSVRYDGAKSVIGFSTILCVSHELLHAIGT